MRDGGVICSHTFGSFGFDAYLIGLDLQQFGNTLLNFSRMRADLRFRQDQSGIYVGDPESCSRYLLESFGEEDSGIGAFPLWIRWRKVATDIACCYSPEQRVSQSMEQHVTIGMAGEAFSMRQFHAADLQRDVRLKLMGIPAITNSHGETLPLMNADENDFKKFIGGFRQSAI
jgi:hypothetical protein